MNIEEISIFLIPLSISILSKELLETLRILYVSENKILLMKNSTILLFLIFIFLIILLYSKIISPETYLYCGAISIFFLAFYYFLFFLEKVYIEIQSNSN